MHAAILVPGIMGTELILPAADGTAAETVWPPEPLETKLGYKRRDKLASPLLVTGRIIPNVLCYDFYKPLVDLLADLGFTPDGADTRLYAFPYDWRRDLFDTAEQLAATLDTAHEDGVTRISLVAHSMGGLICRILLEAPDYRDRPWFGTIDQLIAIATPHLGAPLALGRVLGCDSAMGISGEDFAWLSSLEAYPSAYQLLPAPGEAVCWNQSSDTLEPVDIYDAGMALQLGLKPALLARVTALHDLLGSRAKPASVRYFYFAGAGHRTATRVNVFESASGGIDPDSAALTRTEDSGDGTVPMYSALPHLGQRHIATNEHATAFKGTAFRRVFVRLLGGNEGDALETIVETTVALSVETPVVTSGQDIEVLLYASDPGEDALCGMTRIDGTLVLQRVDAADSPAGAEARRIDVAYAGPALDRLSLCLDPISEPGHYMLSFEGLPPGN